MKFKPPTATNVTLRAWYVVSCFSRWPSKYYCAADRSDRIRLSTGKCPFPNGLAPQVLQEHTSKCLRFFCLEDSATSGATGIDFSDSAQVIGSYWTSSCRLPGRIRFIDISNDVKTSAPVWRAVRCNSSLLTSRTIDIWLSPEASILTTSLLWPCSFFLAPITWQTSSFGQCRSSGQSNLFHSLNLSN